MKKPLRLLWFSNCAFTKGSATATGTWLLAMGEALVASGEIELCNVTVGNVKYPLRQDCKGILQWVIPQDNAGSDGLPSKNTIAFLKSVEQEFQPDLIHIWGTEGWWGSVVAAGHFKTPSILDMQGILFAYAKVIFGNLRLLDLVRCTGIKEVLMPWRHVLFRRRDFENRGQLEKEMLRKIPCISVQSDWVRAHVVQIQPTAKIFNTGIMLRQEFHDSPAWQMFAREEIVLFSSSSGGHPYKGLNVLFQAVSELRSKGYRVELRMAGKLQTGKKLNDGFGNWLKSEVRRLGIEDSLVWLGALTAKQMAEEFLKATAVVIPSFVETYCLALAEAMLVGAPCVVSYAGAMPELARHEVSGLFFSPGDAVGCARQIERIHLDSDLARRISNEARSTGAARNDRAALIGRQMEIYHSVLEANTCKT